MLQYVDKEALRIPRVLGNPITDTLHIVSLENGVGVIAEASY